MSPYLLILGNVIKTEYCHKRLTQTEASRLISAINERYWYQMYLDGLSIVGFIGEMRDENAMLWTHKKFEILYNQNQIVGVSLSTSDSVPVTPGAKIIFTYEVCVMVIVLFLLRLCLFSSSPIWYGLKSSWVKSVGIVI